MSLQAPLSKYSPPTHYFLPINMVTIQCIQSLQIYQQDKIHTPSLGADSCVGKEMDIMGQKIILARLELKAAVNGQCLVKNRFCRVRSLDGRTFCLLFYASNVQCNSDLHFFKIRLDIIDVSGGKKVEGEREKKTTVSRTFIT